jgi:hypothetical protein
MTSSIPKWDYFEASFEGPHLSNPFVDATVDAVFAYGNREVKMPAFYDGGNTWRVRFMPDTQGSWSFRTVSNVAQLDGRTGSFTCAAPREGQHGPVRVRNQFHFAHADGTPFLPFGTTCYAWTHQPLALQQAAHGRVPEALRLQRERAPPADVRGRRGRQGGF